MTFRSRHLLDLARGAPCCADFLHVCQPETVIAAHRNEGKGMGHKVSDYAVAFVCAEAHRMIDCSVHVTRDESRAMWLRAYWRTQEYLGESGLIQVTGHTPREKAAQRLSKIVPRQVA